MSLKHSILGKLDIILTALLEFAEICIISYNIPQARKLLKESEDVLEKVLKFLKFLF